MELVKSSHQTGMSEENAGLGVRAVKGKAALTQESPQVHLRVFFS